jgi:hypothetical protein
LLCCEASTYARLANVGELFDAGGSPLLKAENIRLFQVDIPNEGATRGRAWPLLRPLARHLHCMTRDTSAFLTLIKRGALSC